MVRVNIVGIQVNIGIDAIQLSACIYPTGEALHLAADFRRLSDNFFPHSELAQIIARQHAGTPQAQDRISMVKATQ